MITGISGFGFFCPKMAVSWRTSVFKKCLTETPSFIVFFLVRACLAKLSKKGNSGHPPKKKKLTDNWKALFLVCLCFLQFFLFCSVFLFISFFFVFEGLRVRWGGPKGHLTWPKPSLFLLVCFVFVFFPFLSLLLIEKTWFSPQKTLKKGMFGLVLSVSLCFSLASFGLPLFQFLFLCLLFFSFFFLSSFLSFLFAFFWFLVLISFFPFRFCFIKGTTSTYSITKFFFINPFFFSLVSCLVFSFKSFFLSLLFSWFWDDFVQHQCFWFPNKQVKKHTHTHTF